MRLWAMVILLLLILGQLHALNGTADYIKSQLADIYSQQVESARAH